MMDSSDHAISTVVSHLPLSSLPVVAGCAAFGSTLALSTLAQLKLLGISTGSPRPIPTVIGFASVTLASLASHSASIKAYNFARERFPTLGSSPLKIPQLPTLWHTASSPASKNSSSRRRPQTSRTEPKDVLSFGPLQIDKHTLRICALGLVAFKLLGGRFWAIAPSSYTNLGSFARFSIPATERYATPAQRSALERLGRRVGCHTCGSHMRYRKGVSFHGDHMPPKAVAQQMNRQWFRRLFGIQVSYRFFPQCIDCSNIQGKILSTATNQLKSSKWWNAPSLAGAGGGKLAHYHGLRFRPYHLSGGVVAAVTVADATNDDVQNGNRRRYRELHEQVEELSMVIWSRVKSYTNL